MADLFDQASEREMLDLQQALQAQQEKANATPKLQPRGECLNPLCGEPFDEDAARLFCGPRCAQEFQKYGKP